MRSLAFGFWGPQSAANKYHIQKYGHPSKFGFKDIIPTWKAEKFDPEALMALYQKAPKRDIVGEFPRAAAKPGMRFGVSEHLAVSHHWV